MIEIGNKNDVRSRNLLLATIEKQTQTNRKKNIEIRHLRRHLEQIRDKIDYVLEHQYTTFKKAPSKSKKKMGRKKIKSDWDRLYEEAKNEI